MSWARGLGAALKGTLTGLAEAAEAEDQKRSELTKVALAQRIKKRDEALALAKEQEQKVKEQQEFIETFSNGNFAYEDKSTGKINILSEAHAVALYKQSNGNIEKARQLVEDGNFKIRGEGTVYTPKPTTAFSSTADATLEALKPTEESGGFLQKGRWDQIADSVSKTLGDETITIPALKDVEGVQVTVGKGTDTEYLIEDKVMYVFDQGSTVPSKQIRQRVVTDKNDPSKQEVYNFDLVTNKQITLGDNVKIASAKDAFGTDSMYKDYGFAIDVNTNQALKDKNGNYVAVYQGKDGKFYQNVNGVPSDTPLDKSVVIVQPDAIAAAGGLDNIVQNLSRVAGFDEFSKLGAKLSEKEQVLETLIGNIETAMALNKEIGEAGYGLGGMLNEIINTGVQNVRSVGEFLISFGENGDKLSAEERYRLLSENEGAMRDLLSQRDSLLSTPGLSEIQRRSIAKVLLSTQASLLAYDTARITSEDPRITDQDFNVFQETILGTSAAKTFELLKASSERAIQSFNSQLNALNRARKSIDRNSLTSGTKHYVENAYTYADNDPLNPNNLRQKLDSMYTNYAPVAQKTAVTAITEGDNVGYYAQSVWIDKETLKPTTSANPNKVSMMALYGPDGKIVNVNGNPLIVKDGSAQDLLDKVPGLKKSRIIK